MMFSLTFHVLLFINTFSTVLPYLTDLNVQLRTVQRYCYICPSCQYKCILQVLKFDCNCHIFLYALFFCFHVVVNLSLLVKSPRSFSEGIPTYRAIVAMVAIGLKWANQTLKPIGKSCVYRSTVEQLLSYYGC